MRIICLDDNPTTLNSLSRELSVLAPGSSVNTFLDPETALEFAEENGCDVLFCEIELYGNDGLMFAEKMQSINPRINIIFTTVCAEGERAKEVFRLHPSGYITKPLTQEKLAKELRNLRYPVESSHYYFQNTSEFSSKPKDTPSFSSTFREDDDPSSDKTEYASFESKYSSKISFDPINKDDSLFDTEQSHDTLFDTDSLFSSEQPSAENDNFNFEPVFPSEDKAPSDSETVASAPQPMSTKDLRRLSRSQLLEMLITQTKENDKLKTQLADIQKQLDNKSLNIETAGSIADAAMQVNGIFNAAQRAADQYLENIRNQSQQYASKEKEFNERAERIVSEARKKCAIMEKENFARCQDMKIAAENEVRLIWRELYDKMETYLQDHDRICALIGEIKKNAFLKEG